MSPNQTNLSRGYASALTSSLILATTAIFIRFLTENQALAPLILALLREVIVVLTLLPILFIFRRELIMIQSSHLGFLIIYGVVLAVFNSLWTTSVALNGAAVSTVLVYCSAAFTAILGWLILKESLGWGKLLAIGICLTGCVLVVEAYDPSAWNTNIGGILAGVLAGLGYAVYSLLGRYASQRGINPWTTLLYTFTFAAGTLLVVNLLAGAYIPGAAARPVEVLWPEGTLLGWVVLVILAAGPTLGGYGMYNVSLSYLPSSVANLIMTTEPVFTAAMAYLLLSERLKTVQVFGSLLVLTGVVFLRIYQGRRANRDGKLEPQILS